MKQSRRGGRGAGAAMRLRGAGSLCVLLIVAAACAALAVPAGAAQYRLYFGDLHNHTGNSDGQGTPAQAFAAARAAGADFLAVTDHTAWFGPDVWAAERDAVAAATTVDFAGLAGYEVTMKWGHVNVYNAEVMPTDDELDAMEADSPSALYDWLVLHPGAIGQWNHPTWKSREFADFAGLTPERQPAMAAIEVINDNYRYESSYTKALDRGWKVMPTANSDTHQANWIAGYRQRTVLLAEELTPAALVEALQARRGYATAVPDLRVTFSGNGEVMGSTLAQPARITFAVSVTDPKPRRPDDRVRTLALVADGGRVIAKKSCKAYTVKWAPSVATATAVAGGAHYVFLRVSTAWGRVAWTAPIWTGLPWTWAGPRQIPQ